MNRRPTFSRRELLTAMTSLGWLAAASPIVAADQVKNVLTPEQIMGPFYPLVRPLDQDMDLTLVNGSRTRAAGQVVHLVGRVINSKGEPVIGAKIEIWQANAHGRYAHASDPNTSPLDPSFQGFAHQVTDDEGRYRFKTIKPGAYRISPEEPSVVRTPHIHFDVVGAIDRLVTQMYFPEEQLNEGDVIFNELGSSKMAAVAKTLRVTNALDPDALYLNWDIVLDKG